MIGGGHHRIARQVVDLRLASERHAFELQEEVASLFRDPGSPELQELLDSVAGPDEVLRVDRLDLELGEVRGPDWRTLLRERLLHGLREALQGAAVRAPSVTDIPCLDERRDTTSISNADAPSPDEPTAAALESTREARFRQLLFFLARGRLPWWGGTPEKAWSGALPEALDADQRQALSALLRDDSRARRRLVYATGDSLLAGATPEAGGERSLEHPSPGGVEAGALRPLPQPWQGWLENAARGREQLRESAAESLPAPAVEEQFEADRLAAESFADRLPSAERGSETRPIPATLSTEAMVAEETPASREERPETIGAAQVPATFPAETRAGEGAPRAPRKHLEIVEATLSTAATEDLESARTTSPPIEERALGDRPARYEALVGPEPAEAALTGSREGITSEGISAEPETGGRPRDQPTGRRAAKPAADGSPRDQPTGRRAAKPAADGSPRDQPTARRGEAAEPAPMPAGTRVSGRLSVTAGERRAASPRPGREPGATEPTPTASAIPEQTSGQPEATDCHPAPVRAGSRRELAPARPPGDQRAAPRRTRKAGTGIELPTAGMAPRRIAESGDVTFGGDPAADTRREASAGPRPAADKTAPRRDTAPWREIYSDPLAHAAETPGAARVPARPDGGELAHRPPVDDDRQIYLAGAGGVILHPFLAGLFDRRELLVERAFRDEEARRRAVHLLACLTFGNDEPPEYQLLLPKLLCAMPWEEPLPPRELDDADRDACDDLLLAVLEHWSALRSTSPAWLREQFFLREGKLERVDLGWKLTVERRAQDVLLARLPWGLGLIRLPWMTELLYVSWTE